MTDEKCEECGAPMLNGRTLRRVPRLLGLPEVQEHQKGSVSRRTGGASGSRAVAADPLVEQFLNYLRVERDASPLTLRNYSADIQAFRIWFEGNSSISPTGPY